MRYKRYLKESKLLKRFEADMDTAMGASREYLYTEIMRAIDANDDFNLEAREQEAILLWKNGDDNWKEGLK